MANTAPIDEELLEELYGWVDEIPLSRPKRDIRRDFADGVLVAETVRNYCPKLVELHNYPPANKLENKITNWKLLNRKVFKKLGFELADDVINNVCSGKAWAIEQFLMLLRRKIDRHLYEQGRQKGTKVTSPGSVSDKPEADQDGPMRGQKMSTAYIPSQPQHLARDDPLNQSYSQNFLSERASLTQNNLGLQSKNNSGGVNAANYGQPLGGQPSYPSIQGKRGDLVPKVMVEEKEQEILTKEETIQILQAKVRRLEHLLHLKDIRIDDLQGRLERLESQLRPTGQPTRPTANQGKR